MNNTRFPHLRSEPRAPALSFEAVLREAERALEHLVEEFCNYLDNEKVQALVPWHEDSTKGPNLSGTEIAQALQTLYRYGVEGLIEASTDPFELIHTASPFADRVVFELYIDPAQALESPCRRVVETALARFHLDVAEPRTVHFENIYGEPSANELTLREIALLANMDERSVRNATYENSDDALKTYLRDGRVYVSVLEARRWLADRRGFRPTRMLTSGELSTAVPIAGFRTARDLGEFVAARRSDLRLSVEAVTLRLVGEDVGTDTLEAIERGGLPPLPAAGFLALGRALDLDAPTFASAALQAQITDMSREDTEQRESLLTSITFVHQNGTHFHPCRVKDRSTGRAAFRVSRGGTGGNTKAQTIFVDNEDELRNHLRAGNSVRCRAANGGSANLYSIATRSIVRVEGL